MARAGGRGVAPHTPCPAPDQGAIGVALWSWSAPHAPAAPLYTLCRALSRPTGRSPAPLLPLRTCPPQGRGPPGAPLHLFRKAPALCSLMRCHVPPMHLASLTPSSIPLSNDPPPPVPQGLHPVSEWLRLAIGTEQ